MDFPDLETKRASLGVRIALHQSQLVSRHGDDGNLRDEIRISKDVTIVHGRCQLTGMILCALYSSLQ